MAGRVSSVPVMREGVTHVAHEEGITHLIGDDHRDIEGQPSLIEKKDLTHCIIKNNHKIQSSLEQKGELVAAVTANTFVLVNTAGVIPSKQNMGPIPVSTPVGAGSQRL